VKLFVLPGSDAARLLRPILYLRPTQIRLKRQRRRPVREDANNADLFVEHVEHPHHVAFNFDCQVQLLVVGTIVAVGGSARALQRPSDDVQTPGFGFHRIA
jgi:hypothetical protein